MIWVSGCITVAGLVLGQTEGRNYDVLLCPVKKRLYLTLAAYVCILICEFRPIQSVNNAQFIFEAVKFNFKTNLISGCSRRM